MEDKLNELSLDSLCAALCYAAGINPPEYAAAPAKELCDYVDKSFGGKKADRIFMYNPDAIAEWIVQKYPQYLKCVIDRCGFSIPFQTVMPSVTPVCFGTMYTGAQPEVHGIRKYEKPVIRIDSIFDALLRAGKKPVILATNKCSMSKIYLERDMDYFLYDTIAEVNAKAAELILADEYDFIAVYNGDYDAEMHASGPESATSLARLYANAQAFSLFHQLIENNWKNHDTLIGFAMDHGCHEIDDDRGSHGLDMPEDLNIRHFYNCIAKKGE